MHGFGQLDTGIALDESASQALDLYPCACLALDVLDKHPPWTYDLRPHIEVTSVFQIDRNLLLWPSTTLSLRWYLILVVESALVSMFHELGHLLCHEFVDLGDGGVEDFLRDGADVEVEGRVFLGSEGFIGVPCALGCDAGASLAMDLLLRLALGEHVSVALVVDLNVVRELGIVCILVFALRVGG